MKKDVKIIFGLLLAISLLSSGIFFLMKRDFFSDTKISKEETENIKEGTEQDSSFENKVEQEKQDIDEEIKKEEEKTIIEEPEKNTSSSINKEQKEEQNSSNNSTPVNKEEQDNTDLKPKEPTSKTLTCILSFSEEDVFLTHTMIGVFSTTDHYIQTYKEIYDFDFTDTYEPFTDEMRLAFEKSLKEEFLKEMEEFASAFDVTTKSSANIITLNVYSTSEKLKVISLEDFTPEGDFYYDNFYANHVKKGYVCTLE